MSVGSLVHALMRTNGYGGRDAAVITDHIIDSELGGAYDGGPLRALTVVENVRALRNARDFGLRHLRLAGMVVK